MSDECDHTWRFSNSRDAFVCTKCHSTDQGHEDDGDE